MRASHGRALIAMGSEGESAAAVADDAGLAALLASLDDEVERAEGRRTAEEEAAGMERVREEAVLYGDNPKSSGWHGWAGSMARRFQRFLAAHGERIAWATCQQT